MKKSTFLFILLFLINVPIAMASVPDEEETLYYNIVAYNGKEFSSTFCSNISDDIYLLSNTDNFLTLYQSLLYKWDIADRYYLDYKKLNIPVLREIPGSVEIYKNNILYEKIEPAFYVYYKDADEYGEIDWKVFKGEDAKKRYRDYTQLVENYKAKLSEYNERLLKFKAVYNKKVQKIRELYNKGQRKEAESLMQKVVAEAKRDYPVEPEPPKIHVPTPQLGYIVNLPEDSYTILYRTDDGSILQESEKNLHVFSMRRRDIIGYGIIPEDEWTRPVTLKNPGQVLYVNAGSDLFFQPKIENEYPELYINRLIDNQAVGNKHIWSWTIVKAAHEGNIEVSSNKNFKNKKILYEKPYYVQKSQESRLGYKIIDYNRMDHEEKTVTPSFYGFRLGTDDMNRRTIYIQYTGPDDKVKKGSMRIIKPINAKRLPYWILIIAILPIFFGTLYIIIRNRRFLED